jgi:hypothetical protein
MKNSRVAFSKLRGFLLDLGFQETVDKEGLTFDHPIGGKLLFHRYRDREKVSLGDMLVVRVQLENRGLIKAVALDQRNALLNRPSRGPMGCSDLFGSFNALPQSYQVWYHIHTAWDRSPSEEEMPCPRKTQKPLGRMANRHAVNFLLRSRCSA